jgi:sec-independent protein translocase protein TatB
MFGIGWAELLIIAVVATVVVPPRDLPRLIRGFGHSVRKLIVHTTETSAA